VNVWQLFLIFEIVLGSVVLAFVFVGWLRKRRMVSKAHSPEHRLKIPNVWTEFRHAKQGGSTYMMRMNDGNFVMLSVGHDATKVLVGPRLDSLESFTELASFSMDQSHKHCRGEEVILNQLRAAIGSPQSIDELRHKLENTPPLADLRRQ
jgi:hypothetical protein